MSDTPEGLGWWQASDGKWYPPEQAQDTKTADHRADSYSLGCTLYRLLTGAPVYDGESVMNKMMAHWQKPIPSLREARQDVSEQLDAVFQRMVAKKPEDRQASMTEVIAQLETCVPAETRQSGPWPYPAPEVAKADQAASPVAAEVPTQTQAEASSLSTRPQIEANGLGPRAIR